MIEEPEFGECWTLPEIKAQLQDGAEHISVRVEDSGDEFTVGHDFAPKEREILVEGGLLHYLSEHGEQVSGDADGEGEGEGLDRREGEPLREEAGEGPGGPNRAV